MTIAKTGPAKARGAAANSTRGTVVVAAPDDPAVFPEHARVRPVREIREGDESVPAGATGTIVHVIEGGVGYDVEFILPKHIVLSASRAELALA